VALDDCFGDIDDLASVALRVRPQQLERAILVDRMANHQDALCLLDQSPAPECSLQAWYSAQKTLTLTT
jgi:hypothetical protein